MPEIRFAQTDAEIAACFATIHFLRPHLIEAEFVPRVRRQQTQGYQLLYIAEEEGGHAGDVAACAGFRFIDMLYSGRQLYIDDLITRPTSRKSGYAGQLLDWLIAHARETNCDQVHLDSGYQRNDAHRLYLNKGFVLASHHFSIPLK